MCLLYGYGRTGRPWTLKVLNINSVKLDINLQQYEIQILLVCTLNADLQVPRRPVAAPAAAGRLARVRDALRYVTLRTKLGAYI